MKDNLAMDQQSSGAARRNLILGAGAAAAVAGVGVAFKLAQAFANLRDIETGSHLRRIAALAQLVAHHTVNGCSLSAGDLFGSGTLSGTRPEQAGSLLEQTVGGKQPLQLPVQFGQPHRPGRHPRGRHEADPAGAAG